MQSIRAQRQAQHTPSRTAHPSMLHVCHRNFMYTGLLILRALPSPCYQDNFKLSRGAGAAPELLIPSRGSSGFAQALPQHAATQAENTPWWHLVARGRLGHGEVGGFSGLSH